MGRFVAEDVYWNAYNCIYSDNTDNSKEPVISAMRQSANKYEYCMSNPIRYIDLYGADAEDTFKSAKDAAIDFGKEINGKSIEENAEYAAFIYKWEEKKKILVFLPITKTYYSYTEPFTNNLSGNAFLDISEAEVPNGAVVVAGIHTHGAFKWGNIKNKNTAVQLNDNFSENDEKWALYNNIPLYLVNPAGALKIYNPAEKNKNINYLDSSATIWLSRSYGVMNDFRR